MNPLRLHTLLLVFLLSLFIFIPLRWDAEPWLRQQLANIQQQLPLHIDVASLKWSGLGVTATGVDMQTTDRPDAVHFRHLRVEPDWLPSLQGRPAVRLQWQGDPGEGRLSLGLHDAYVEASDMDIRLDTAWLQQTLALPLPVTLQGPLVLTGEAQLLRQQHAPPLKPLAAQLQLRWQQAAVTMGEEQFNLGDYQLTLKGQPEKNWQWQITGGETLKLEGKGQLQSRAANWPAWPLAGEVMMQAQQKLAAVLGEQHKVRLSGTLLHPQWR